MYPDFKELLSELNAHQVKYLIVGGYAVSVHSQPWATKDLDIFIRADLENGRAAHQAPAKFGAPVDGVSAQDLTEPDSFFRMGMPSVMVDILPTINGVDFDLAWQRRVEVSVDEKLVVPIISRDDLVSSKLAAGRAQDLADVEALKKFAGLEQATQPSGLATDAFKQIEEMQREGAQKWQERTRGIEDPAQSPEDKLTLERGQQYTMDDDFEI